MSKVQIDPDILREAALLLEVAAGKIDCNMPHTYASVATRFRAAANQPPERREGASKPILCRKQLDLCDGCPDFGSTCDEMRKAGR